MVAKAEELLAHGGVDVQKTLVGRSLETPKGVSLACRIMQRSETRGVHVRSAAKGDLSEGWRLHVIHHHLAAGTRAGERDDVIPKVADGVRDVVRANQGELLYRPGKPPDVIGKHAELARDDGIVEVWQGALVGQGKRVAGQLVFKLALERMATEKVDCVATDERGPGEMNHVDVPAADFAGVNPVTQKMDAPGHLCMGGIGQDSIGQKEFGRLRRRSTKIGVAVKVDLARVIRRSL